MKKTEQQKKKPLEAIVHNLTVIAIWNGRWFRCFGMASAICAHSFSTGAPAPHFIMAIVCCCVHVSLTQARTADVVLTPLQWPARVFSWIKNSIKNLHNLQSRWIAVGAGSNLCSPAKVYTNVIYVYIWRPLPFERPALKGNLNYLNPGGGSEEVKETHSRTTRASLGSFKYLARRQKATVRTVYEAAGDYGNDAMCRADEWMNEHKKKGYFCGNWNVSSLIFSPFPLLLSRHIDALCTECCQPRHGA